MLRFFICSLQMMLFSFSGMMIGYSMKSVLKVVESISSLHINLAKSGFVRTDVEDNAIRRLAELIVVWCVLLGCYLSRHSLRVIIRLCYFGIL